MRRSRSRIPAKLADIDPDVLDYAHNLLLTARSGDHVSQADILPILAKAKPDEDKDDVLARYRKRHPAPRPVSPPPEPIARNVRTLAALLHFDEVDIDVLRFAVACAECRELQDLFDYIYGVGRFTRFVAVVASAIARPRADVERSLASDSNLVRCGFIQPFSERHGDVDDRLDLKCGLVDLLMRSEVSEQTLLAAFLPEVTGEAPPWLDHDHLANEVAIVRTLLREALARRAKGINILLYGDTGTGKTALAKSLARDVATPMFAARASDDDDNARGQRLSSLLLGLRMFRDGGALLLFDEFEDVFDRSFASLLLGKVGTHASKDSFTRLFEDTPTPVIWTTNHVRNVDPAVLRRFIYAIHVRSGGVRQRANVLHHHLGLPDGAPPEVDALAERFELSPAQLASAARAAPLVNPAHPLDAVATLLEGGHRLMTGRTPPPIPRDADGYQLDAINASIDLNHVVNRLATWSPASGYGVTMCLYGPPGTGKTEFVRHLAKRMGRRTLVKRVSDLVSPFIGETERNMAHAFEQATEDDAVLVFDEVDSFLQDRRSAARTWEITEVNEMLQQMEAFRGVFAATTNLWERLDPAVMRRFTFKIELRPPTPDQATALFWAMFEPMLADPRVAETEGIVRAAFGSLRATPGDLAAVRRRLAVWGTNVTVARVLDEIRAEVGVRVPAPRGFAPRP